MASPMAQQSSPDEALPGAADSFAMSLTTLISNEDLSAIQQTQLQTLKSLHLSNVLFSTFLDLSDAEYESTGFRLRKHMKLLKNLKKDLQDVHKKINQVKDLAGQLQKARQRQAARRSAQLARLGLSAATIQPSPWAPRAVESPSSRTTTAAPVSVHPTSGVELTDSTLDSADAVPQPSPSEAAAVDASTDSDNALPEAEPTATVVPAIPENEEAATDAAAPPPLEEETTEEMPAEGDIPEPTVAAIVPSEKEASDFLTALGETLVNVESSSTVEQQQHVLSNDNTAAAEKHEPQLMEAPTAAEDVEDDAAAEGEERVDGCPPTLQPDATAESGGAPPSRNKKKKKRQQQQQQQL